MATLTCGSSQRAQRQAGTRHAGDESTEAGARDARQEPPVKHAQSGRSRPGRRHTCEQGRHHQGISPCLQAVARICSDNAFQRSNSLPRTNTAPSRNPRTPSHLSRPPVNDNYRPPPTPPTYVISSDSASEAKSDGYARQGALNGGAELNIRGAAVVGGPYIVKAQNFAPGTTAADIESVMANIGGELNYCRLSSSHPTVIAEMSFPTRDGADKVIDTFNGKKVRL